MECLQYFLRCSCYFNYGVFLSASIPASIVQHLRLKSTYQTNFCPCYWHWCSKGILYVPRQTLYLCSVLLLLYCWTVYPTKYIYISTVPQCLSPRPNWDPHHPLYRKRVCPLSSNRRGRNTRLRVRGWGGPNSDNSVPVVSVEDGKQPGWPVSTQPALVTSFQLPPVQQPRHVLTEAIIMSKNVKNLGF